MILVQLALLIVVAIHGEGRAKRGRCVGRVEWTRPRKGYFREEGGVAPLNAKVLTGVDRATIITLSVLSETLHPPR